MNYNIKKPIRFVKSLLALFIIIAITFILQFVFYPIPGVDLEFTSNQVVAKTIASRYNLQDKIATIKIIKRYRDADSYIFVADDGTNHYLVAYKRHLFLPIYSTYSAFPVENYPFVFSMKNGSKSYRVEVSLEGIRRIA